MLRDDLGVLGLSAGASPAQIKSAYRRLARRFHPDQADTGNKERFQEIQAAYARLSGKAPAARTPAPPPAKPASTTIAEAFLRDLGVAAANTGAKHARQVLADKVSPTGRMGRAAAAFAEAVIDDSRDAIEQALRRPK